MSATNGHSGPAAQATTSRIVVGLFRSHAGAEAAVRELTAAGFAADRIGVAMQGDPGRENVGEGVGADTADGAAKGAVSGGLVGGLLGLLGSVLVPGLGPVVAGGVLASMLTGAGIGAATGGVLGALVALGLPDEDAQHFDSGIRSGGTLVTVDARERTPDALAIMARHEVDLGPSGASRYEGLDWITRDNAVPAASAPSAYPGVDRRVFADPEYPGPERRLVGL